MTNLRNWELAPVGATEHLEKEESVEGQRETIKKWAPLKNNRSLSTGSGFNTSSVEVGALSKSKAEAKKKKCP